MKKLVFAGLLLVVCSGSCSSPTDTRPFKKQAWVDDPELDNPYRNRYHDSRQGMVEDLMQHHLKKKMSKADILTLLGQPDQDGIEQRVPKDIVEPDSISIAYAKTIETGDSKKWKKLMDDSNKLEALHARPDTLVLYILGQEGGFGIDYKYLAIELSGKGLLKEAWVETH